MMVCLFCFMGPLLFFSAVYFCLGTLLPNLPLRPPYSNRHATITTRTKQNHDSPNKINPDNQNKKSDFTDSLAKKSVWVVPVHDER